MATKESTWVLLVFLVISFFVLGSVIQAGAEETLKWKNYSYVTKSEREPIGDVDGHFVSFANRRSFCVFENGEIATAFSVITSDSIKGSGSALQYTTMTFADGSTIVMKLHYVVEGTAPSAQTSSKSTREIIKGTGRFEGIKGTGTGTTKYLPLEKGELGQKGIGDFSITYTLPSK